MIPNLLESRVMSELGIYPPDIYSIDLDGDIVCISAPTLRKLLMIQSFKDLPWEAGKLTTFIVSVNGEPFPHEQYAHYHKARQIARYLPFTIINSLLEALQKIFPAVDYDKLADIDMSIFQHFISIDPPNNIPSIYVKLINAARQTQYNDRFDDLKKALGVLWVRGQFEHEMKKIVDMQNKERIEVPLALAINASIFDQAKKEFGASGIKMAIPTEGDIIEGGSNEKALSAYELEKADWFKLWGARQAKELKSAVVNMNGAD